MRKEEIKRTEERIHTETLEEALSYAFDDESTIKTTLVFPMPKTSRDGEISRETQDVVKDLLDSAYEALEQAGYQKDSTQCEMLHYATTMVALRNFQKEYGSVCILSGDEQTLMVGLNDSEEPIATVSETYYIKPLIHALGEQVEYNVLELHSDSFGWRIGNRTRVENAVLPDSVHTHFTDLYDNSDQSEADMKKHEDNPLDFSTLEGHLNQYHNHQSRNDVKEETSEKWLRYVMKTVREDLADDKPIILVAVPEIAARFRKLGDIPQMLDDYIPKNPDAFTEEGLVTKCCEIIDSEYAKGDALTAAYIESAIAHGKGSSDLDEIASAARDKRIAMVVLGRGRGDSGAYDFIESTITKEPFHNDESGTHSAYGASGDIQNDLMIAAMNGGASAVVSDNVNTGESKIMAAFRW